ncbi:uncharacterized protein BYT42DRAFT_555987 [Radiomyces spectabilis]|uniref:uncharacterized protein n=1 Tax=Radiomyces spectabilis TaxID=64574 RepID=UPI00221E58D7|nr:uncharacterized protein BYT42DRAFT_555987 [Radiomyces spectabilis]KAI8391191.1 hypothetical protein BYT42DRAFT_555987 [Radiomyces spectabilis]
MTILGSLPLFGSLFSSTSKPDRIRKSIAPISTVLKRQQPFSTSSIRAYPHPHPQVKGADAYHHHTGSSHTEPITESSIMSNFPRPNLMPTLHFSLFGLQSPPNSDDTFKTKKCSNCAGPHSTDFCPC